MNEFPINHPVGDWVRASIASPGAAFVVNMLLAVSVLSVVILMCPLYLVWLERKISARMQARLGPNRVGPYGLFQTLADMVKLLCKEIITPTGADTHVFFFAPILPITASCLIVAVLPFDHNLQVTDLDAGALYAIGISGMGVFGVLLAGWASNNKFSLLGALRSGAQMISYAISIALNVLFIVMVSGSASLREIVLSQQGTVLDWWVFKIPGLGLAAFVMYLISSTAELNRGPFDIAEAEQEIAAGFHTEYAGTAFAMFFMAEYLNMFIATSIGTVFFLGGFLAPQFGLPLVDPVLAAVPGFVWFFLKMLFFIFVYMLLRWSLPRPRVDQLMYLEWKILLPGNVLLLLLGGIFVFMGWIL